MRVLMVSKACLVGLYQRKLEEIAKHPSVSVLQVLVPPSWKDERGEMLLERAHTQGYDLTVTPICLNGNFHLHFYPRLAHALDEFRPDILHIDEEPYNLATWLALRAARQRNIKTLFFSWQNIKRQYPLPFRWGEEWVLRTVDHAIMGTDSAAQVWREKGYRGPLAVIPQFGVDPDAFAYLAPRPKNPLTISFAGRLVPEKGVDLLLQALTQVQGDWQLQIIGGGPQEQALRQQTEALKLTPKVIFVGQVPSMEMPQRFRELDILVIPSRTMPNWKEQFGRVIIEAMAAGVVVVGSDSGAIPDVIGEAGLIFPENHAQALAHALQKLINDLALRQTLAETGRKRVLDLFTQAEVARQTVAVYQTMMTS